MSSSLGFGLITCQRHPGDGRPDAQLYAWALDLSGQAEQLGLDSVWVSERVPRMVTSMDTMRRAWRGELAAAGRTGPFPISVHLPVFTWEEPGGWEMIRDYHRDIAWKYEDMEGARGQGGEPQPPPSMTSAEEEILRESIILGAAAEVASQIDSYRRAAGGDLVFVARLYFPGLDFDIQCRALAAFGKDVAPRVRDLSREV